MVRAAKAAGLPVTAEATPHHFTLTDASCAGYDPVFKVNPPLRTDADVAAVQAGLGRRHHRRHRHRPRPARAGAQGAAVRPGAARDARPRDGAGARPHRARPRRSSRLLALLSWQPAAIAGIADAHGGPVAAGAPPTSACSTRPPSGPSTRRRVGQSQARNTPFAGRTLQRPGAPHHPRGEPVVDRRRGATMSHRDPRSGCWCWPTARPSKARPSAPSRRAASPPARSCSTPC